MLHGAGVVSHVDAYDGKGDNQQHDGNKQVHENAGEKNDRALPERQRAIRMGALLQIQVVRVFERTRLSLFQVDAALRIAQSARAKDVVLVAFLRADKASPVFKHIQNLTGIVHGNADFFRKIVRVNRPVRVGVCEGFLNMRVFLARFHATHFRIAAKRNGSQTVARPFPSEADIRSRKTDHELGHANAERACRKIVATFVHEDQNRKNNGQIQDHHDNIHARPIHMPQKTR